MRTSHSLRATLSAILVALFSATIFVSDVPGQPPGKGGGGGGTTFNGGGTIYFWYGTQGVQNAKLFQMNDDGSGVRELPIPITGLRHGAPSYQLHGGLRWFIRDLMIIEDEWHTVLISEQGHVVPLFPNDGFVRARGARLWADNDCFVSFLGQRIDDDVESPTFGQWIDFGLYRVEIAYDGPDGYPLGVIGWPELVFPTGAVYVNGQSEPQPDMGSYSWAASGLQFIYLHYSETRMSIGDIITHQSIDIPIDSAAWYGNVRWSPSGEKILYAYAPGNKVMVMNVDGTGVTEIAARTATVDFYPGDWSPTGSHLTYRHQDAFGKDSRIMRATSTGGSKTRITSRSQFGSGSTGPVVIGWR